MLLYSQFSNYPKQRSEYWQISNISILVLNFLTLYFHDQIVLKNKKGNVSTLLPTTISNAILLHIPAVIQDATAN